MLIKRVGSEASKKNVGRDIFDKIVDHVAPSGVPTAGSSFAEKSAILTEHGIAIPMSSYTDIALLGWGNVPDQDEFAHVAAFYDPEVEEIYDLIFHHDGERATFDRCMQYVEGKASDNLDAVTILSMLYRSSGRLEDASDLVNDGFFIASLAWAPIAKARRRHHDPIRWWDEKSTRPLMRLLHEKGFVEVYSQTPEGASRARQTFGKLLALNPADPLNVRRFADTDIVFYDEEKVPELMESHAQRHRT
jgi:hypothetical protein